jgi:hypothetical protein
VAIAALRTGINMPGITHIIHLIALYSIINYTQEARCARRARKRVITVIIIEDKD